MSPANKPGLNTKCRLDRLFCPSQKASGVYPTHRPKKVKVKRSCYCFSLHCGGKKGKNLSRPHFFLSFFSRTLVGNKAFTKTHLTKIFPQYCPFSNVESQSSPSENPNPPSGQFLFPLSFPSWDRPLSWAGLNERPADLLNLWARRKGKRKNRKR